MNVFISEFLRTARLGEFGLGTPAAEIVAILGEPWKDTEDLPVNIWQFGDLEFNVQNGIIVMIMLVVDANSVALPPELHVEDMREWAGRPMQEVEDWLTKVGVATTTRSTGESLRWALSSGAALTFMNGAVDSVSVLDRRIGG